MGLPDMAGVYTIMAWDVPGSSAIRDACRKDHFAHVEKYIDRFLIAGPLKGEDGTFTGSLLIVKAENEQAATELFKADPYFAAGVWDRWEIRDFLPAAGDWAGGKSW